MTPDVAIVGGGVIGWSTAWHLLRSDPQLKVVVVDPHPELRSSLRGTGGIRAQFGSGPNIQMSLCSIRALENFAEEVGHDIGFRQHGYLFFTCDKERAIALESLVEFQRSYGVPVELLSGGEVRSRLPMLRLDSVKVG
ncbi:MAG TPA: FAD-dependent oxidoreductase, partial [Fimbriimonadaceae bacterium]|nr:FAD-dependent oxidoreductase [Fimbriimonadaceae bacterium]